MTTHPTAARLPRHDLVSLRDAADHLHVSVKTVRRRISDGTITGYRVGRLVRLDLDDIEHELLVEIPSARRT
ncbi:helix-turn-helix domain-containing protein [Cellulosimicrobium sp. KWT-B]|uniref:helix-turn-helix domain-containing protein n=1 Tax=Cellulosimicrobium sp. KWT-B TaxID=1981152 RepID=UPI001E32E268|nr:helix-turn-helix domain-containing protein [Cellulosimicrobium sp. KWT-B]